MQKRRLLFWIVRVGFCFLLFFQRGPILWAGNWRSAVVISDKGKIVYAQNMRKKLPPASTVKVLTAMVVIDHLNLDKWVCVSRKAAQVEPSKAYLGKGNCYKVKDLVYAMLMASANDAALALAEAVSGRESEFAKLLNKKAYRCGAKHSRFYTATGLPAKGQFTTSEDLAKIMRYAVRYGLVVKSLNRKIYSFVSSSGKRIRVINHNKLLWNKKWSWIKGKTGFTKSAGQCFLGYFYKGGKLYTFAFLGGKTLWNNIKELVRKVR